MDCFVGEVALMVDRFGWSWTFARDYCVYRVLHGLCHEVSFMHAVGNPCIAAVDKPFPYNVG